MRTMVGLFMVSAVLLLAGCGGGSGSDGRGGGWTVDGVHHYARKSSTQDAPPVARGPHTAIYSQGNCDDIPRANYQQCSILVLQGPPNLRAGEYDIYPHTTTSHLVNSITVQLHYANSYSRTDRYYQVYAASSGRVRVSVRQDGIFVFDLIGEIPMRKIPSGRNPEQPLHHAPNAIRVSGEGLW